MNILGISAYYHDAAAAILCDGEVVAAAQEERFSRVKNDDSFPESAIAYCINEAGLDISDLDAVVFYEKPLLKFERLLETYYANAPNGLVSFLKAMPVWIGEKAFIKKKIKDGLSKFGKIDKKKTKFLFPEHHLSHIASAYFASPFEESAFITLDGVGEWATSTIGYAKGNDITVCKQTNFPHSLGLLYSAFTYYLGFKVNSGEYKLMGLAPYGNPNSDFYKKCLNIIRSELVKIYDDGSIWLNQKYFSYATKLRMAPDAKWEGLFGIKKRLAESELTQQHCDMALAIQSITEEVVINMAMEAKRISGSNNLCMAGGVALNCVANGKLADKKIFENIFIQPAAGDSGGALGAALAANYIYYRNVPVSRTLGTSYEDTGRGSGDTDREEGGGLCVTDHGSGSESEDSGLCATDHGRGSYLGPGYINIDIKKMARRYNAVYKEYQSFEELSVKIAELLAVGKIIGFFQGRMEFGPRALGNRSIIADPRNPKIQKQLNLKTKFRESFRPFAPAVLAEDASKYFDIDKPSPYMLFVHKLKEEFRLKLPDNYANMDWKEKLETPKSMFPAITHVDFSARVQTVDQKDNQRFWTVLSAFKKITGHGMLVNTSMNVRGEPMVCSPADAYLCFMNSGIDYLICEDILFDKNLQPPLSSSTLKKIDGNND